MKNYTTTGNGIKIHLRNIKEVYIKDGKARVKYSKKESSFAPYKTSCGRYDDDGRAVKMIEFFEASKTKDVCQVCLNRMRAAMVEARKLENR